MIIKLYEKNNNPKDLARIVEVLEEGGIIIYPTDTMYAIGCHALKERAIERICKFKGIDPRKHNLSIICYDLSNISEYAKVDNNTFKLMKRNLPGPFTFILNTGSRLPKIFKNRKEVGIRIPDHEAIREICQLLDAPILTTTLPLEDGEDIEYITTPELIEEIIVRAVTAKRDVVEIDDDTDLNSFCLIYGRKGLIIALLNLAELLLQYEIGHGFAPFHLQ